MTTPGREPSAPVEQILGRPAMGATLQDVLQLDHRRVLQVFRASACPSMAELDGEYRGISHPAGPWAGPARLFLEHWFGPGRWVGKAFQARSATCGHGYNLFADAGSSNADSWRRARKLETRLAPSAFDGQDALHLDYRGDNRGAFGLMHDELRKVNDDLFLGLGYLRLPAGRHFSSAFVIYGPPLPWVGC
jgi:hypothetical protein